MVIGWRGCPIWREPPWKRCPLFSRGIDSTDRATGGTPSPDNTCNTFLRPVCMFFFCPEKTLGSLKVPRSKPGTLLLFSLVSVAGKLVYLVRSLACMYVSHVPMRYSQTDSVKRMGVLRTIYFLLAWILVTSRRASSSLLSTESWEMRLLSVPNFPPTSSSLH